MYIIEISILSFKNCHLPKVSVSYLKKVDYYNIILFFSKWQFLNDKIGIIKKSSKKYISFYILL
jgi:hypothetical protein